MKPLPLAPRRRSANLIGKLGAVVLRAAGGDVERTARAMYGKNDDIDTILKAATSPATLPVPAWAGVLGHNVIISDLIQKITALSAAAALMQVGTQVDLSGKASVTVPGRQFDPYSGGAWVAEGAPIPLRSPPILAGPKLEPRKLAVLSAYTREMIESDSIEDFVTMAVREAAAALLDQRLFSTTPAAARKP